MLKFLVYRDGILVSKYPIHHAYLIGSDQNAIRSNISFDSGAIVCEKRESGVAALALQHPIGHCGCMVIRTCLLPERKEPYLLSLELARHRLLLLYQKLEDWAMFDVNQPDHPVIQRIERARHQFIEALCYQNEDLARGDRLATKSLVMAVDASEELSLIHADLLLTRRRTSGGLPKYPVGCGVMLDQHIERVRPELIANIDFFYLPTFWRHLAPEEGGYRWEAMDNWAQWLGRNRMPTIAGPLVGFEPHAVPDWLFIWEHDYDTVRDLIYEHTERVVTRYRNTFAAWNVISGIHVNSHFTFSFDQLMELSRMTTMLVRKIQPAARTLVEICHPFGEYYATNQRSIPPLMYADLLTQSGINFDGIILKLLMGQPVPGRYPRDLMQISTLLDKCLTLGKPITVVVAVPSDVSNTTSSGVTAQRTHILPSNYGYWRNPWSESVQTSWLEATFKIALSKPFVDGVAWYEWMDRPGIELAHSGLVNQDMQPKPTFRQLVAFRKILHTKPRHQPFPSPIVPHQPLGEEGAN